MKGIVLLIDGTWDHEGLAGNTNVAKLDSRAKCVSARLIPHTTSDGIRQIVHYHKGLGVSRDPAERVLGDMIGFGLKIIIRQVYECLSSGDAFRNREPRGGAHGARFFNTYHHSRFDVNHLNRNSG